MIWLCLKPKTCPELTALYSFWIWFILSNAGIPSYLSFFVKLSEKSRSELEIQVPFSGAGDPHPGGWSSWFPRDLYVSSQPLAAAVAVGKDWKRTSVITIDHKSNEIDQTYQHNSTYSNSIVQWESPVNHLDLEVPKFPHNSVWMQTRPPELELLQPASKKR